MGKTNQSAHLIVDEIEVESQLMRNKIADIIEEVYVTEVKSLVHDEFQQRCEGCEMDDSFQLHHDCLAMVEEGIFGSLLRKSFKERLNIKSLWLKAQKRALLDELFITSLHDE